MAAVEDTLRVCPLRTAPYPTPNGICRWCGANLTGRRTRWCSDACSRAVGQNHDWSSARVAALRRDGNRCVRCGADGQWAEGHAFWRVLRTMAPLADRDAIHEALLVLIEGERAHRLEVNHLVPIHGKHGQWGCHHHLDGLETLCRPCHVAETARQFRDGEIRRRAVA